MMFESLWPLLVWARALCIVGLPLVIHLLPRSPRSLHTDREKVVLRALVLGADESRFINLPLRSAASAGR